MGEFNKVTYLYGWCQKIIPLVYDDSLSYYEMLCKVREKLNEVITNTNMIPDMIKQEVQDFINSGQIEDMIGDILTGYLQQIVVNVVVPPQGIAPANGNGNDDTETFQQCIDYLAAKGGGLLFVPDGQWLTGPLTLKNGVYIHGSCINTRITLKGGSNAPLISGDITAGGISDIALNANGGFQPTIPDVVDVSADEFILKDVSLEGGEYGLELDISTSAFVENVNISACNKGGAQFYGAGAVYVNNITVNSISSINGVSGITNLNDNSNFSNCIIKSKIPTGFKNGGNCVKFDGVVVDASVCVNNSGDSNKLTIFGESGVTGVLNTGNRCHIDFSSEIGGFNTAVNNSGDNNSIYIAGNNFTTIITDTGNYTNYDSVGENSQTKIGRKTLNIGTENPVMYRHPEPYTEFFDKIPFTDYVGVQYDVLVGNENTPNITDDKYEIVNVANYSPVADGAAHPLSEKFDTLEEAQAVYSVATALTNYIDWCAIQQAIVDAQAQHKNVFIPGGNYLINNTITVDNANGLVSVWGEGLTETKIEGTGITVALYIKGSTTPALYRTFQTFKGFLLNYQGQMTGRGIMIEQCAYLLIDTVLAHNFESGVYLQGCEHSRFLRFQAEACGTGVTGPELNLGTYTAPNNILFESCILGGNLYGVNIQQGADITFLNCSVENNSEYGIGLSGLCYQGGVGANFIGCYFENNAGLGHIIVERSTNAIKTACALNVIGCSFNFTAGSNYGAITYTGISADLDFLNVLGCGFNKYAGYTEGAAQLINPNQTSFWRYGNKSNMTTQGANINVNLPITGDVRYTTKLEYYNGTAWADVPMG